MLFCDEFTSRPIFHNQKGVPRISGGGPAFRSLLDRSGSLLLSPDPGMIIVVSFALLCLLSAILAWIDIQHGIIPDWLNLAIAGLGLSKALIVDGPLMGLEAACGGGFVGGFFSV